MKLGQTPGAKWGQTPEARFALVVTLSTRGLTPCLTP
jgi:hypothetical protein